MAYQMVFYVSSYYHFLNLFIPLLQLPVALLVSHNCAERTREALVVVIPIALFNLWRLLTGTF